MDFITLGILGLLFLISIIKLWFTPKSLTNYPPGPRGVPILGNLIGLVCRQPHEKMREWGQKYGSVTELHIGSNPVVILNDWMAVKEAFIKQASNFSGRLNTQLRKDIPTGFILNDGQLWQEQRHIVINSMKHLGFGKSSMEAIILEGAHSITSKIDTIVDKETSTGHFFNRSVINVLWRIIAGKKFTEEECTKIARLVEELGQSLGTLMFISLFHSIYENPLVRHSRTKMCKAMADVKDSIQPFIDDHKQKFNPDELNDFIDMSLAKIAKTANTHDQTAAYTDEKLLLNTFDLLAGGIETSSTALEWLMFFMCKYRDVQLKVQQEIDQIIGDNSVSFGSREMLIYTEATIMESLRSAAVLPLGLPHRNFKTTELLGYTIPANTMVIANIHGLNHDNLLWDNPSQFRPERFIKDGKITKPPHFVPFSCGLRVCPGEKVASQQLFTFFVSIMQKFSVAFPGEQKEPDMKTVVFSTTVHPPVHKVIFMTRV